MIEKQILQELINQGKTIWEIVDELNYSRPTIQKYIKYHNIQTPKKGFYSKGKPVGRPKGIPMSESQKEYLSKKFVGKGNPFYGNKHTKETCRKMSKNHADFTGDKNPFKKSLEIKENRRKHEKRCKDRWDKKTPEEKKQFGKKMQTSGHKDIPGYIWHNVKNNAKLRKIKLSLTIEDVWDLFLKQNKRCTLTGLKLKLSTDSRITTASLDRIDSTRGYTVDNIQWVHKWINIMKNSLPTDDFIYFCGKVAEHYIKNKE